MLDDDRGRGAGRFAPHAGFLLDGEEHRLAGSTAPQFGLVFPTANADTRDFDDLAERISPPCRLTALNLPWPPGTADRLASMTDTDLVATVAALGSPDHLRRSLRTGGDELDMLALAVTSASFLVDPDGQQRQIDVLAEVGGCPATTTTRAFQDATVFCGFRAVAVASVYPPVFTDAFVARLAEVGVETVSRVDANARTDADLAAWDPERIAALVADTVSTGVDAEAVVLPETALHTHGHYDLLVDAAGGRPVLTALHVTLWSLYRHLGLTPTAPGAGPLFA